MEKNFWLQRWEEGRIAFHRSEVNPVLVEYFKGLSLEKGDRIFVPLCGKTLDIAWLLAQGYRVAGAELIEMAVEQLFTELGVTPKVVVTGEIKHYSAENIDIFVGNVFDVSDKTLGPVDAIYDRAALVALPKAMRDRYAPHLVSMTHQAPQLLITYEYDQNLMAGPPFSISPEEVSHHYSDRYNISLLKSTEVPGGLKGQCVAEESVWLLEKS
ncbi:thiopurine S-methyltransferase [Oscillatoria sp. CS-180]|uniref:thiopurine S-methyltransferase n=1 Tax=Oscillatoria sp. CS-180 TaxID=3021720 RepID=UPI00232D77DA|nr:thiopurine S-methyltransferase [Oscillatoria sp. CS-180]MDB9527616.1 thiopurine S-methyltransferase [Oscillatoria sp. CS-180]